ncbi:probable protein ABIL5 isoform X2 [Spinacia oleracea]|uniref:Probable protein ABIL5 isoform X2 n=1 Tax=Spinacia oleracea TaxID=3562 RepID=A0A9R0J7H7_SPIOL|nr:probable protein ABIL5 isoform X2 [Spinacia oleracea]
MLKSGLHANNDILGADSGDCLRFLESLKELKELRAQIHKAADYCEKSYLKSEDKAIVLEDTKEYLCRAIVTVVDHLGCVSASLDGCIQKSDRVDETQRRINCMKQKLDSCDQYKHNFTLTKLRWSKDLPRYYPRYISPTSDSSKKLSSDSREPDQPTELRGVSVHEFKTVEETPLFGSKRICLGTSPRSPLDITAKEFNVALAPKLIRNPPFHFQDNKKLGGIRRLLQAMQWKSVNEEEIISSVVLRRSKRRPSRLLKLKL